MYFSLVSSRFQAFFSVRLISLVLNHPHSILRENTCVAKVGIDGCWNASVPPSHEVLVQGTMMVS